MLDLLSIIIGLVVGGLVVAMAIEVMGRMRSGDVERFKLTTAWRLSELADPVVVARDLVDVEVPRGATVYASGVVASELLVERDVHQVPPVPAEFAVDMQAERALLFLGGVQEGDWALVTVDPVMVARLRTEAKRYGTRAGTYVERLRIGDMAGRAGVPVETVGTVQDVLPWKDRWIVRLEDQGQVIGVLVDKDPEELREERIQVRGRLDRDSTGYLVIAAEDIRRIR